MGRQLNLDIPAPCSESWEAMQPQAGGRHCTSCSRTIVDFTAMSDAELARFVANNGHACGRFRPDQLGRDLQLPRKPWPRLRAFVAISLPAMLLSLRSAGQAKPSFPTEMSPSRASSQASQPPADTTETIRGIIRDEYGNPVPHASVLLNGTRQGTSADANGIFELRAVSLPATITVSSVGYEALTLQASSPTLGITLRRGGEQLVATVGMVVVRRTKKPRRETRAAKAVAAVPSILIYPNPATSGTDLTVQGKNLDPGAYRLELYNLAGQLLQRGSAVCSAKSDRMRLSTAGVPAGHYLLRVVNEKTGRALSEQVLLRN